MRLPRLSQNTLGTCKHILYTLAKGRAKFSKTVQATPPAVAEIGVYLRYGHSTELRLLFPDTLPPEIDSQLAPLRNEPIEDIKGLLRLIGEVERLDMPVTRLPGCRRVSAAKAVSATHGGGCVRNPSKSGRPSVAPHPAESETAALSIGRHRLCRRGGAGRLADDMGLGKTIQGIGVAELLSRHVPLSKVLIICPASLKSQWRIEIQRFCDHSCRLVLGSAKERPAQYEGEQFFTICNYEQVLRDLLAIERVPWDLIILDEGQRIKNWAAKNQPRRESVEIALCPCVDRHPP